MSDPAYSFLAPSPKPTLDRASGRRGDKTFLAQRLDDPGARVIALVGTRPVIRSNAERTAATLAAFSPEHCPGGRPTLEDLIFLGIRAGTEDAIFARSFSPDAALEADPSGTALAPAVDIRSLAMQGVLPLEDLAIAATAAALVGWHETARYCGRCGSATRSHEGGWQRRCTACDLALFPRTDPVVIMLVTAGDHCVLARQPAFPPGMVSSLAGFIEPGETIEAAVAREVKEEIGIAVSAVRYLASQPWPFPHSLMIGCHAEAEHAQLIVDPTELESARWISRAEVRGMLETTAPEAPDQSWVPGPHAIARWLIARFAYADIDQR